MSISGGFQNTDGFLRVRHTVEHGVGDVLFVFGDEETRETERAELGGLGRLVRADDERGNATVLVNDLHGRGLGTRDGEVGRGGGDDHALGRDGVLDLAETLERGDGV